MGVRNSPDTPVYACGYCNVHFIEPDFPDAHAYYEAEYRQSFPEGDTPEERFRIQYHRSERIANAVRELVPTGGSVLDIGCSTGGLLAHLQNDYTVFGAEWNKDDAAFVRDVGEVPCEEGDLLSIYPDQSFTAITAIQVLEHQPDPVQFIRDVRSRLIGGGYLYMEVPALDDALLTQYDIPEFAEYYYRKPHITYWNAHAMAGLMGFLGFEAHVEWVQRYGLASHTRWLSTGTPLTDAYSAQDLWAPVPKEKRSAAALNRIWRKLDHEYRVQLRTLYACDTISVKARVRQI